VDLDKTGAVAEAVEEGALAHRLVREEGGAGLPALLDEGPSEGETAGAEGGQGFEEAEALRRGGGEVGEQPPGGGFEAAREMGGEEIGEPALRRGDDQGGKDGRQLRRGRLVGQEPFDEEGGVRTDLSWGGSLAVAGPGGF